MIIILSILCAVLIIILVILIRALLLLDKQNTALKAAKDRDRRTASEALKMLEFFGVGSDQYDKYFDAKKMAAQEKAKRERFAKIKAEKRQGRIKSRKTRHKCRQCDGTGGKINGLGYIVPVLPVIEWAFSFNGLTRDECDYCSGRGYYDRVE